MTYNPQRCIIGAISLEGKMAYHLFNIDVDSSEITRIVKLCRKSKWHPQYSTESSNLYLFLITLIFICYFFTSLIWLLLLKACSLNIVNLLIENVITGLDFDPTGECAATIDRYGVCLISEVNTDFYRYHVNLDTQNYGGNLAY